MSFSLLTWLENCVFKLVFRMSNNSIIFYDMSCILCNNICPSKKKMLQYMYDINFLVSYRLSPSLEEIDG